MPFFRRRTSKTTVSRKVTVYSKPGCHLCEEALALLNEMQDRWPLEIEEVDISRDPTLMNRYGLRIPVLVIDGAIELEAPITEKAVRAALG